MGVDVAHGVPRCAESARCTVPESVSSREALVEFGTAARGDQSWAGPGGPQ